MTDQEILDNAPEGATHVEEAEDGIFYYRFGGGYASRHCGEWSRLSALNCFVRSLEDIRRIAELEEETTMLRESLGFKKELVAIENLRQQAKGVDNGVRLTMMSYTHKYSIGLMGYAKKLRKQAYELEKGECS